MSALLTPPLTDWRDTQLAGAISDWRIVPAKTRITFSMRHFFWTLRGAFRQVRGVVRLNEADPRYTHVDVRIPVAGVTTGSPWRDRRLAGPDLLDGSLYPAIYFHGWWLRGDPHGEFALDGELRVRDVGREITLQVTAHERGIGATGAPGEVTYHATTTIDRRDFGLEAPALVGLGGTVLGHEVKVALDLSLHRVAPITARRPRTAID
jgi:polyisoprenoid-binding protein YceI